MGLHLFFIVLLVLAISARAFLKVPSNVPAGFVSKSENALSLEEMVRILQQDVIEQNKISLDRFLPQQHIKLQKLLKELKELDSFDTYPHDSIAFAVDPSKCSKEAWYEKYFYYLISQAVSQHENGFDPFAIHKFERLTNRPTAKYIQDVAYKLIEFVDVDVSDTNQLKSQLSTLLEVCLWSSQAQVLAMTSTENDPDNNGNSNIGLSSNKKRRAGFNNWIRRNRKHILNDDIDTIVDQLVILQEQKEDRCVDIIVDKCGASLIADLLLGHVLLTYKLVTKVRYHTSAYSDRPDSVTNIDISGHCEHLADPTKSQDIWAIRHFGEALKKHVLMNEFEFIEGLFWCQPQPFWDMPQHIQSRIQDSKMVFVKGDANYRRLLGERDWPMDTPASDILSYWPVPVCALRTFESNNVGCGLNAKQQSVLIDPVKASSYGIIQFKP